MKDSVALVTGANRRIGNAGLAWSRTDRFQAAGRPAARGL